MKILVLNAGSSSDKISLFEFGETIPENQPAPLWEGRMEWHGEIAEVHVKSSSGAAQRTRINIGSFTADSDTRNPFVSARTKVALRLSY